MLTRVAAVALIVVAALAFQAAFLHTLVAVPLASAIGALQRPPPAATFEESITVVAERRAPRAEPAS